jgi:hypothetical protein
VILPEAAKIRAAVHKYSELGSRLKNVARALDGSTGVSSGIWDSQIDWLNLEIALN